MYIWQCAADGKTAVYYQCWSCDCADPVHNCEPIKSSVDTPFDTSKIPIFFLAIKMALFVKKTIFYANEAKKKVCTSTSVKKSCDLNKFQDFDIW